MPLGPTGAGVSMTGTDGESRMVIFAGTIMTVAGWTGTCRSGVSCWMCGCKQCIILQCEDYELDFSVSRAWYGGDFAAIVGECECQGGMEWDNHEL